MSIEESVAYIWNRMHWKIKDETFEVLEKETCAWIAEVETTHLTSNVSFWIIVQGYTHFVIEKRWRHVLAEWVYKNL